MVRWRINEGRVLYERVQLAHWNGGNEKRIFLDFLLTFFSETDFNILSEWF